MNINLLNVITNCIVNFWFSKKYIKNIKKNVWIMFYLRKLLNFFLVIAYYFYEFKYYLDFHINIWIYFFRLWFFVFRIYNFRILFFEAIHSYVFDISLVLMLFVDLLDILLFIIFNGCLLICSLHSFSLDLI